ncbi:helix-turn-helix domain-containing protein [Streptosporangium sp. NPDC020145]|uniref:helix-turn-helix domain-containing protein n=1 Tax=Streptosporangium sp. NPDC020145 TaxID=3154694 RepID=UPI00343D6631
MQKENCPLLTLMQAATMLGVSRMTVDRAVKAGEIPSVKFRRTYKVPRNFVERLINVVESGESVVVEEYAAAWKAR